MVLSDMEAGRLACVRIGGPLLFGHLWERLGLGCVVNELLDGRGFEFALKRAIFVSVLHRLCYSARRFGTDSRANPLLLCDSEGSDLRADRQSSPHQRRAVPTAKRCPRRTISGHN